MNIKWIRLYLFIHLILCSNKWILNIKATKEAQGAALSAYTPPTCKGAAAHAYDILVLEKTEKKKNRTFICFFLLFSYLSKKKSKNSYLDSLCRICCRGTIIHLLSLTLFLQGLPPFWFWLFFVFPFS